MYGIVKCPRCGNKFIVEDYPETTKCGRCRKAIKYKKVVKKYKTEDIEEARKALGILNAAEADRKEEFVDKIKNEDFFEKDLKKGGIADRNNASLDDVEKIKRKIRKNNYSLEELKENINLSDEKVDNIVEKLRLNNLVLVRKDNSLEVV